MNETRYVQYKNDPNGTKWALVSASYNANPANTDWFVAASNGLHGHYIPKSEYIPCTPPERWTDITAQCEPTYNALTGTSAVWNVSLKLPHKNEQYTFRLRKVKLYKCEPSSPENCEQWAFIVEKRED